MNDQEFKIAESIGGLTSTVQGFEKKFTEFMTFHNEEHRTMWKKLDSHGKKINMVTGFFMAVGTVFGLVIAWVKAKMG